MKSTKAKRNFVERYLGEQWTKKTLFILEESYLLRRLSSSLHTGQVSSSDTVVDTLPCGIALQKKKYELFLHR